MKVRGKNLYSFPTTLSILLRLRAVPAFRTRSSIPGKWLSFCSRPSAITRSIETLVSIQQMFQSDVN